MRLNFKSLIRSTVMALLMPLMMMAYTVNGYADVELDFATGARLVAQGEVDAPYYILPVSSIRKVNGVIAAEHNLYLAGTLMTYTWEIVPGIGAERAHDLALSKLKQIGAEVLFTCQGRACGSSNQWANQVFQQSRLYGLDKQQSYTALQQTSDYYALYTTQRGNRKVYLHLEHLHGTTNQLGQ